MSTYKVIQDIEAEDKLLGPLTLRQFIYALVSVFFLYLCFIVITKHAIFLLAVFLPPAVFSGFFAFPFMKDQPTEVWALAKIRFMFKPRRRIWDQSGVKELVTITVPKKIEKVFTDGLTQNEVRSRLGALANTLDSRGWAIKNVNVNMYSQPLVAGGASSDRLIDLSSMPQQVPSYDVQASDDILDEQSNPIAQQFDQMITASTQAHRQQIIERLSDASSTPAAPDAPTQPADYWFLNQPATPQNLPADQGMFGSGTLVLPGADESNAGPQAQTASPEEEALAERIKASHESHQEYSSHLKTLQPLGEENTNYAQPTEQQKPLASSPVAPNPAILSLANNNDLNVATIARQANKSNGPDGSAQGEVVISLR